MVRFAYRTVPIQSCLRNLLSTKIGGRAWFYQSHSLEQSCSAFHALAYFNKVPSIWVQWLYSYWLNQKPFWTSPTPSKCSWSLKKIYEMREEAASYITYKAGIDSRFLLWHDPWANTGILYKQLGPNIVSIMESMNGALLENMLSLRSWQYTTSNHVAAIEFRQICATFQWQRNDRISWDSINHVNISSLYNFLRLPPAATPAWNNMIWHNYSVPKFSILGWLIMRKRLLTLDRMIRFGMVMENRCILCLTAEENHSHIFCECEFTQSILSRWHLQLHINRQQFEEGNFLVNQMDKTRQRVSYLFLAITFHAIWNERNKRRHDTGHRRSASQLTCEIMRTVREKMFTCKMFQRKIRRDPDLHDCFTSSLEFEFDVVVHFTCLSRWLVCLYCNLWGMP